MAAKEPTASEDPALAYELRATNALGFGKGPQSQTSWRF